MRTWILATVAACVCALAVGCGGGGGGNAGDGGTGNDSGSGATGCRGFCEHEVNCVNQAFDGGAPGFDGGVFLDVNTCTSVCEAALTQESAACRNAVNALSTCLNTMATCSDTSPCATEGDAVDSNCSNPPTF